MDRNKTLGIVSLVSAAFLWGLWGVFSRILGLSFGVFYQGFSRSLILFVILLICAFLSKSWKKIENSDFKWFFIISVGGLASGVGSFISFNYLTIGETMFYYYSGCVVGSYLLGKLFFAEQLTKAKIIALVLSLTGLLIIFYSAIGRGEIIFIILALIAGIGGSLWGIFSKKVTAKYPLIQVLLVDNFNFTIGCLILMFIFKEAIIWPNISLLWLYVFLFSMSVLAASFLHFYGFKYVQAQIGSLIMLLEVIFSVFLGWLFYKEILNIYSLIGGSLILFGAALPHIILEKKNK